MQISIVCEYSEPFKYNKNCLHCKQAFKNKDSIMPILLNYPKADLYPDINSKNVKNIKFVHEYCWKKIRKEEELWVNWGGIE